MDSHTFTSGDVGPNKSTRLSTECPMYVVALAEELGPLGSGQTPVLASLPLLDSECVGPPWV